MSANSPAAACSLAAAWASQCSAAVTCYNCLLAAMQPEVFLVDITPALTLSRSQLHVCKYVPDLNKVMQYDIQPPLTRHTTLSGDQHFNANGNFRGSAATLSSNWQQKGNLA